MKEIDIEEVRKRCESDQIKWSLHAFKRLRERNISKDDYKNSIFTGENRTLSTVSKTSKLFNLRSKS